MREAEDSDDWGISVTDVVPDYLLDKAKEAVQALPGYSTASQIIGQDPIFGDPVQPDRQVLIDELLTYGPFGAGVGAILSAMDVLGSVYDTVMNSLVDHDLTLDRVVGDIGRAYEALSASDIATGDWTEVQGYISAVVRDVEACIDDLAEQLIEVVRGAVATLVEPLLQTPEIQPIWTLATKVFHHDPLHGTDVEAPTAEILGDFLRLIGEDARLEQMQANGTLQATADWLDEQFATFDRIKDALATLFTDAWTAIQPENLVSLPDTLPALVERAFGLIGEIGKFVTTVMSTVLDLIKESLLGFLSEKAHEIPGFELLTVILGQDPFTGVTVPRTAESLIGGFIKLLPGGEQTYEELASSGVIGEAAGRIEAAMARLGISWELITGTIAAIWDSVSLDDLLDPFGTAVRIIEQFGEPLGRIVEFIAEVVQVVVGLILRLMNFPSELLGSIISQTLQAVEDIKRDPIGFLENMVEAVKLGLQNFFDNILPHLMQGLADWLFRGLGDLGITIPTDLSLASIFATVVEVLGLSMDLLWRKLGEHIGPERVEQIRGAIDAVSGAWSFIKDVQQGGFGAIWDMLASQLGGIWDSILDMAQDWIMTTLIEKAIVKLLSFLDPTGVMAVINSFIAFFNAVQSAIEYIRDILEIVNTYVSTAAAIARGDIAPGAAMLEGGLASSIPVAIGFLANQLGLGDLPDKVVEIIGRIREVVEAAIDWLIAQALRLGQAALNALGTEEPATAEDPEQDSSVPDARTESEMIADLELAVQAVGQLMAAPGATRESVQPSLPNISRLHRVASLNLIQETDSTVHVEAVINPRLTGPAVGLLTRSQERAIDSNARTFAAQIRRKNHVELYRSDPDGYVSGDHLTIGTVVEDVGLQEVLEHVDFSGTVLRNVSFTILDNAGDSIVSDQAELDFLLVSGAARVEIVSAKWKRRQFSVSGDRAKLRHYVEMAGLRGQQLVEYARRFGRNVRPGTSRTSRRSGPAFGEAASVEVHFYEHEVGQQSMVLGQFFSRYLRKTIVDTVAVVPLTPSDQAGEAGLAIPASSDQLRTALIDRISHHL